MPRLTDGDYELLAEIEADARPEDALHEELMEELDAELDAIVAAEILALRGRELTYTDAEVCEFLEARYRDVPY